jgi:hypothetical protein
MEQLNLPKVTLIHIDGVNPDLGYKCLKYSKKEIKFGECKLITYESPAVFDPKDGIEIITIPKFDGYYAYNQFVIAEMVNYINTEHSLMVQPDGFVANPPNFKEEFYQYDYIGAVFDEGVRRMYQGGSNVGNGGFTWRSKNFLEIISQNIHDYDKHKNNGLNKNEDFFLCKTNGDFLKMLGVKFAPEELAPFFSLETKYEDFKDLSRSFGFHGYHSYTQPLIDKVTNE